MLEIVIGETECFDEASEQIVFRGDGPQIQLEHSLLSLSKWEQKYKKPFLTGDEKSADELLDYVFCMVLTPGIRKDDLNRLSEENVKAILLYIKDEATATWFSDDGRPKPPSTQIITSELIYYWLFAAELSIECEKWHLNRLFTLLKVVSAYNAQNSKKGSGQRTNTGLSPDDVAKRRALNAQRLAEFE